MFFSTIFPLCNPKPDVFPLGTRLMAVSYPGQDVTNGGEPMSLTDSLVKPLWQAPVLGKDSGERTLPRDWNNSRNKRQGMEVGKRLVFSSGWLKEEKRK